MTIDDTMSLRLRRVAMKLTSDRDLQNDLLQEMLVYMSDVEKRTPGKTLSWYIKGGEYCARNYLKRGRSIDSFKRRKNACELDVMDWDVPDAMGDQSYLPSPVDIRVEVALRDIVECLMARLSAEERKTLELLLEEFGVCEIARRRGVSHVT